MARIKAKSAEKVQDIVKEIKIFDAIVHAKVAWESTDPETIKKCFSHSGVRDNYNSPPTTPVDHDHDPEFAQFFQDLDVPWDEYLAMDEELEGENPSRAPDAESYNTDDNCMQDISPEVPTTITYDESLDVLQRIQKSNLDDLKLLELLETTMNHIQNKKTVIEISNKFKQLSIAKYFQF